MPQDSENKADIDLILAKLNVLEKRMANVEEELGIASNQAEAETILNPSSIISLNPIAGPGSLGFESRIGGYGLALMGNVVLLFGIIFLSQYIQNTGHPLLSAIFGFFSAGAIFLLAHFSRKSISYLYTFLNLTGHIMLYYVILRLHYFSNSPLIENSFASIILIFIVISVEVYISMRKKSQLYAGLAILLTLITGVINRDSFLLLGLTTIVAGGTVFLFFRLGWRNILIQSMILIYLAFLIWFVMSTTMQKVPGLVAFHHYSHFYLLACAGIFSLIALAPPKEKLAINFVITTLLLNGILFSFILALFVVTFFPDNYNMLFLIISLFCIIYSIILKSFSSWKFSPAFYAMYGFVAISITVFGIFKMPYIFLLLALQGLFVAVIALWFRSRILVSMNAVLFHMLLLTYLVNTKSLDSINFTFAAVAIITSWILNKKKQLLELASNLLPDIYMVTTFFMILFSLFKFVPQQYVTLSWTLTAIGYFLLSLIFQNVTYRWMAILTIIATALYLFIVDLSRISIVYRIIAFLFLAVISISISIYYTRIRKTNVPENQEEIEKEDKL